MHRLATTVKHSRVVIPIRSFFVLCKRWVSFKSREYLPPSLALSLSFPKMQSLPDSVNFSNTMRFDREIIVTLQVSSKENNRGANRQHCIKQQFYMCVSRLGFACIIIDCIVCSEFPFLSIYLKNRGKSQEVRFDHYLKIAGHMAHSLIPNPCCQGTGVILLTSRREFIQKRRTKRTRVHPVFVYGKTICIQSNLWRAGGKNVIK